MSSLLWWAGFCAADHITKGEIVFLYGLSSWAFRSTSIHKKIPSEMDVAPRYNLITLLTLLTRTYTMHSIMTAFQELKI